MFNKSQGSILLMMVALMIVISGIALSQMNSIEFETKITSNRAMKVQADSLSNIVMRATEERIRNANRFELDSRCKSVASEKLKRDKFPCIIDNELSNKNQLKEFVRFADTRNNKYSWIEFDRFTNNLWNGSFNSTFVENNTLSSVDTEAQNNDRSFRYYMNTVKIEKKATRNKFKQYFQSTIKKFRQGELD